VLAPVGPVAPSPAPGVAPVGASSPEAEDALLLGGESAAVAPTIASTNASANITRPGTRRAERPPRARLAGQRAAIVVVGVMNSVHGRRRRLA
jgi:hypothetical protein